MKAKQGCMPFLPMQREVFDDRVSRLTEMNDETSSAIEELIEFVGERQLDRYQHADLLYSATLLFAAISDFYCLFGWRVTSSKRDLRQGKGGNGNGKQIVTRKGGHNNG
jgi:hypothetical protein